VRHGRHLAGWSLGAVVAGMTTVSTMYAVADRDSTTSGGWHCMRAGRLRRIGQVAQSELA